MVYYLIEKHMQKFRHFGREKKLPKKVTYVPLAQSHSIADMRPLIRHFFSNHLAHSLFT